MNNKVSIVIPVYRKEPDEPERMSLVQCFKVLCNYHIIFFCGSSFDCIYYEKFAEKYNVAFQKRTFSDNSFKSKEAYNALCLSKEFYTAFTDYEFILIYQLDAWVFRDELAYWCNTNYDYIGAPYPIDLNENTDKVVFFTVGNGGFSLRRVQPIVDLLGAFRRINSWQQLLMAYKNRISKNPLFYFYVLLRYVGFRNTIGYLKKDKWEDHFFSEVGRLTPYIRVPTADVALRFSFEYKPTAAFTANNAKLPFGCHGWTWIEYDEFWSNHIKS